VFPLINSRRAVPQVISIFRQARALDRGNARPLEDLIPRPGKRNIVQKIFAPRDYRLSALITLLNARVIQRTGEGKLFLSEKELAVSKWKGN
jgi:hypothetical protein